MQETEETLGREDPLEDFFTPGESHGQMSLESYVHRVTKIQIGLKQCTHITLESAQNMIQLSGFSENEYLCNFYSIQERTVHQTPFFPHSILFSCRYLSLLSHSNHYQLLKSSFNSACL